MITKFLQKILNIDNTGAKIQYSIKHHYAVSSIFRVSLRREYKWITVNKNSETVAVLSHEDANIMVDMLNDKYGRSRYVYYSVDKYDGDLSTKKVTLKRMTSCYL